MTRPALPISSSRAISSTARPTSSNSVGVRAGVGGHGGCAEGALDLVDTALVRTAVVELVLSAETTSSAPSTTQATTESPSCQGNRGSLRTALSPALSRAASAGPDGSPNPGAGFQSWRAFRTGQGSGYRSMETSQRYLSALRFAG